MFLLQAMLDGSLSVFCPEYEQSLQRIQSVGLAWCPIASPDNPGLTAATGKTPACRNRLTMRAIAQGDTLR
jgi:hypothetical protein